MRRDPRKRYSLTQRFSAPERARAVFGGLMPRRIKEQPGYVLHMVVEGDRLDALAQNYYGDARLWWVIAQANPGVLIPVDLIYQVAPTGLDDVLKIGVEIHIPPKPEEAE